MIRNWHSGTKISTSLITKKAQSCGIEGPVYCTALEANTAYNICKEQFDLMKPKSAIYRRDFIWKQIRDFKDKGGQTAVKSLQIIQGREKL